MGGSGASFSHGNDHGRDEAAWRVDADKLHRLGQCHTPGGHQGALTRIQDNQGNFGSTAVMVGANGKDSVFLSISGQFAGKDGGDKCVFTSTGTYTVTGGAGAFANATGSGTISTQFDLCANTASGTYTGTISQPNSN